MLAWEPEERKPNGLLEKRYGIAAETQTHSGGESFELLGKGRVEIALGAADQLTQLEPDCRRICCLSKLYVTAIARTRIESVHDLQGQTFGYLTGSAFGMRLDHLSRTWGIRLPQPLALETVKDCVQAMLAGRIQGMVGSEPSVSRVGRAIERSLAVFRVRQGMLGTFEMHMAVNRKLAHPAAVRAYLRGLEETTRYANARKSVAAFQAEVAARFQMEQG